MLPIFIRQTSTSVTNYLDKNVFRGLDGIQTYFTSFFDKNRGPAPVLSTAPPLAISRPTSLELDLTRASCLINSENYESAITVLDDLIERNSLDPRPYSKRSEAHRLSGDINRAINDLKKSISLPGPSPSPSAYARLGIMLWRKKEYDDALCCFRSIVFQQERDPFAWLLVAKMNYYLEKFDASRAALEHARHLYDLAEPYGKIPIFSKADDLNFAACIDGGFEYFEKFI